MIKSWEKSMQGKRKNKGTGKENFGGESGETAGVEDGKKGNEVSEIEKDCCQ